MIRAITIHDIEAGIAAAKHYKEPMDVWRTRPTGEFPPLLNLKRAAERKHEHVRCFPDGTYKRNHYVGSDLTWSEEMTLRGR